MDMIEKGRERQLKKVLEILSGNIEGFYLGGGTALSFFYFQHRVSLDIDLFTQDYSAKRIMEIVGLIEDKTRQNVELIDEINKPEFARMKVFMVNFTGDIRIKVDFVEDFVRLLEPLNTVNGIPVLSLKDIYLRKVFAIAGTGVSSGMTGREIIAGGREEAKDFFDVYYLSSTFMPLSEFAFNFTDRAIRENLIRWFRTYDRFRIMSGILDLETTKKVDYKTMERYFTKEINGIIEKEVGEL